MAAFHGSLARTLAAAITALAICAAPALAADPAALKECVEAFIAGKPATIGVAIIHDGSKLAINNDERYPLMSVFKLHQAIAILKMADQGGIRLSDRITARKEDLPQGTYSPLRDRHPEGNIQLSVKELLEWSLRLSDNNACDLLFSRILDPAGTDRAIRSLGVADFSISRTEADMHADPGSCRRNWSTPLAVAELLEKAVFGDALSAGSRETLAATLTGCETGKDRIPGYLPAKGTAGAPIVGHKTGTADRNAKGEIIGLNDAGLVILPGGARYVIAILIKDSSLSYEDTAEIIARISGMAYESIKGDGNPAPGDPEANFQQRRKGACLEP